MFESLLKTAAAVVTIPVAIAADIATLGGVTTDRENTYTSEALSDLMRNLKDATRPPLT